VQEVSEASRQAQYPQHLPHSSEVWLSIHILAISVSKTPTHSWGHICNI